MVVADVEKMTPLKAPSGAANWNTENGTSICLMPEMNGRFLPKAECPHPVSKSDFNYAALKHAETVTGETAPIISVVVKKTLLEGLHDPFRAAAGVPERVTQTKERIR
jgi:hypothetical protein